MKYLVSFVSFALAAPAAAQDLAFPIGPHWVVNGEPVLTFPGFSMWPGGGWAMPVGGMIIGSGLDRVPGVIPGDPWGLAPFAPAAALGSPRIDPGPWVGSTPMPTPLPVYGHPAPYDTSLSWRW